MYDAVAIIRSLTSAGITREHADAIVSAIGAMADHDKHVTTEQLDARVSAAEARIYRAMLIQTLAILGGLLAILRLIG